MEIQKCRLCGCRELHEILNLGYQKFTGVFPRKTSEGLGGGVLRLLKCSGEGGCGLVQLAESFDPGEMFGVNYGYHSSLNLSMVTHLKEISGEICGLISLNEDDVILDIGSNDGALLGTYLDYGFKGTLIGIDPSAGKFRKYYKQGIKLVEDFFSAETYKSAMCGRKAKVVTSIAMFYDLEDPIAFARDIEEILDNDGIWVVEQSYLPLMVRARSYDTVCHEHIEFYTLKQISYIADRAGLKVIDVSRNETNGGSFRITLAKTCASYEIKDSVREMEREETEMQVNSMGFFFDFTNEIELHKKKLMDFLTEQKRNGKVVLGYGASTKGNVVLQYCQITKDLISAIVEVNSDKYGCVTPGTDIPIISEEEGRRMNPDYFVVLPWHFKNSILEKEKEYREMSGAKFVFYLPEFEIV